MTVMSTTTTPLSTREDLSHPSSYESCNLCWEYACDDHNLPFAFPTKPQRTNGTFFLRPPVKLVHVLLCLFSSFLLGWSCYSVLPTWGARRDAFAVLKGRGGDAAWRKSSNVSRDLVYAELLESLKYNDGKGIAWDRLAEMTDAFGPRLTGSAGLENSINWMVSKMKREDDLNVWTEDVLVDIWQRGEETLIFHSPTRGPVSIPLLGLGRSPSTPPDGITAPLLVVETFEELDSLPPSRVRGRIVLFNYRWTTYGSASTFRTLGPAKAEAKGAVAVLVRSAGRSGLRTPRTGYVAPSGIPSAAIPYEDAAFLHRVYDRFEYNLTDANREATEPISALTVTLTMNSTFKPKSHIARNVLAQLNGREKPEEIVVIAGHMDSWDVGVGAIDDGGGVFTCWEALRLLSKLKIPPKRSVRFVAYVNEEQGGDGGRAYVDKHRDEISKTVFALESDSGVFEPWGLHFLGTTSAYEDLSEMGKNLLGPFGWGNVTKTTHAGSDIHPLCTLGVPCAGFESNDPITNAPPGSGSGISDNYFLYHHSQADTMEALDPVKMTRAAASMAIWVYGIADAKEELTR